MPCWRKRVLGRSPALARFSCPAVMTTTRHAIQVDALVESASVATTAASEPGWMATAFSGRANGPVGRVRRPPATFDCGMASQRCVQRHLFARQQRECVSQAAMLLADKAEPMTVGHADGHEAAGKVTLSRFGCEA